MTQVVTQAHTWTLYSTVGGGWNPCQLCRTAHKITIIEKDFTVCGSLKQRSKLVSPYFNSISFIKLIIMESFLNKVINGVIKWDDYDREAMSKVIIGSVCKIDIHVGFNWLTRPMRSLYGMLALEEREDYEVVKISPLSLWMWGEVRNFYLYTQEWGRQGNFNRFAIPKMRGENFAERKEKACHESRHIPFDLLGLVVFSWTKSSSCEQWAAELVRLVKWLWMNEK